MKNSARLAWILPVLLTLAVFWQTTGFDFVSYDDEIFIYDNPYIAKGLTREAVAWAFCADLCFSTVNADYWQPMTMLSRMFDIQVWGLNPFGHHLTNLLLHLANVALLYFVFLILFGGNLWLAAWLAAGFGIHPVQADIVPWVTARKDVSSFFFGFWTLLAYLRYTEKTSWLRYWIMLPLYACSLMSKPTLVTLPALLLIFDYWPLERWKKRAGDWKQIWLRLAVEKWGLFILAGVSIFITRFTQSQVANEGTRYYHEVFITTLKYFRDFIFPINFSVYEPEPEKVVWKATFVAGIALILLTYVFIRLGRKQLFLRTGWLWFLTALAPVMALRHEMRFLVTAGIGLLVLTAWGFLWFCRHWKISKTGQWIAALALLGFWAVSCFAHAGYWRNSLTLGLSAVRVSPDSAPAHVTLATALWENKDENEAVRHFTKALELKPGYDRAHADLATLLGEQGKNRIADFHFKRALELDPRAAQTHNNYGVFLANGGKCEEAMQHYRKALELSPRLGGANINLSNCLWEMGRKAAAISEYAKAMPSLAEDDAAQTRFGFMLAQTGRDKEAGEYFGAAIKLNPHNAEAYNNWGVSLTRLRRQAEARAYFNQAIKINPQYTEAYNNLGNVFAAQRKWDQAAALFQKALELDPSYEVARHNLKTLNEEKQKFIEVNKVSLASI